MKTYHKPILNVCHIEPQRMMAGSDDEYVGFKNGSNDDDHNAGNALGNSHRGAWDSLWGVED